MIERAGLTNETVIIGLSYHNDVIKICVFSLQSFAANENDK